MKARTLIPTLLGSLAISVPAEVAVSNLGQANPGQLNSNVGTVGPSGSAAAQGFVTGPEPAGYQLESVTLRFLNPGGFGATGDLDVELWDSVAGKPGAIIGDFGVNNPDSGGEFEFPLDSPVTLAPNTRYFISASTPDAATSGQNVYFWEATPLFGENPGGLPGWSIDDGFRTSQGVVDPDENTNWGNETSVPLQVGVKVSVPTPPLPPALGELSYNPATGVTQISLKGEASTRYKLVKASDLDFTTPDQDPVPLTAATVGTLDSGGVLTDANGDATVTFSLGTDTASFVRAEELP